MDTHSKKQKTCPEEAIRFADLVPRADVRGGRGSDKILFGTLDSIVRRGLAIRRRPVTGNEAEEEGTEQ